MSGPEIRTWEDMVTEDVAGKLSLLDKLKVHIKPVEAVWGVGWELYTMLAMVNGQWISAGLGALMVYAGAIELQERLKKEKLTGSGLDMYCEGNSQFEEQLWKITGKGK